MVIDFHTHAFPDKIAKKTIDYLSGKSGTLPFSDGTVEGLLSEMRRAGADLSVQLPVLTSPKQFDTVNGFAKEMNLRFEGASPRIVSFAGIHPDSEGIEEKMRWIKDQGFSGVKIHPDYQGVYIDDDRYVRILSSAKENDLIVITHAGVDAGYRECPVRCTPERVLNLIRKVPYGKLVLAHLGGNEMTEEVISLLSGEDLYLDTAYLLKNTSRDSFLRVLEKHGEDRILFASDSPWSGIKEDLEIIRSFKLKKDVEDKILFENARQLLKL